MPEILETGVTLDDLPLLTAAQLTDKFVVRRDGLDRALPLSLILALFTNGAPVALDTWLEVVQRLEDDEDALAAINSALGNRLRFDAAQSLTAAQQSQGQANLGVLSVVPDFFQGLTLSNNVTDANNDIDISAGSAKGNGKSVTYGSAMGKRLDAAWVAGGTPASPAGGLDTGTKSTGATTYHAHSIVNNTTGVGDFVFSLSATAPTVPSGWTRVQRLGSVLTDGSGNNRAFSQDGNTFLLSTMVNDISDATLSTTSKLYALTVPNGIKVDALIRLSIFDTGFASALVTSPDESDQAAGAAGPNSITNGNSNGRGSVPVRIRTNTSRQIRAVGQGVSLPIDDFQGRTFGWIDTSLQRI